MLVHSLGHAGPLTWTRWSTHLDTLVHSPGHSSPLPDTLVHSPGHFGPLPDTLVHSPGHSGPLPDTLIHSPGHSGPLQDIIDSHFRRTKSDYETGPLTLPFMAERRILLLRIIYFFEVPNDVQGEADSAWRIKLCKHACITGCIGVRRMALHPLTSWSTAAEDTTINSKQHTSPSKNQQKESFQEAVERVCTEA
ncbi:unnamed protein product [Timema podura]|uniref:Uncharacterized protein n=1 Tax=Timema podura TaxID=61482 RepID=A0ABN7NXB2_TIMPD|nr:unnamed protein product [Timema podura]